MSPAGWLQILADFTAGTTFNKPWFSHYSNEFFSSSNEEGFKKHLKTCIFENIKTIKPLSTES